MESFQKRERDRRKREKRQEKSARKAERATTKTTLDVQLQNDALLPSDPALAEPTPADRALTERPAKSELTRQEPNR